MSRTTFLLVFIGALVVYIFGFSVTIMDVDSAQYASITREMVETGNYLQVHNNGQDYLDKPPLTFWISALSLNIFGNSNWAFKIGAFLFTLLGVYSTFRLGKLLYNANTGRLAAAILFTCQAFFLFNNDVRTDTILTASVIFAIWQLVEWLNDKRWKWLIGASLGIALAMMAKGPIGLMVPVLAVSCYLVGKARWSDFLNWQYLVIIALVLVFISPMLWGLYTQFDAQPEKSVPMITPQGYKYEKGVSGLKFYFWTQSFGRLTGENTWRDNSGPFFFIHNLLWSFMPWVLLFVMAFFSRIAKVFQSSIKGEKLPELLTLGGFLLPFIALSSSQYKLPHYIFVVYPLAAILLASWWEEVWEHKVRGFKVAGLITQLLAWVAATGVVALIYFQFFQGAPWLRPVLAFLGLLGALFFILRYSKSSISLIAGSVLISLSVNFTLNSWFYPKVTSYQWGNKMAEFLDRKGIDDKDVFEYHTFSYSFNFYSERTVNHIFDEEIKERLREGKEVYVVTPDPFQQDLRNDFKVHTMYMFGSHPVTQLTLDFLNPETRSQTLHHYYLIKILGYAEHEK